MSLRLFVAVELAEPVIESLTVAQHSLKQHLGTECVRWTDPRGTHLTLKFIGETDERRLPDMQRALAESAATHAPMGLALGGVGVFPNRRRPRVIWIGLEDADSGLANLQASVERAMGRLGLPPEERPFSPHLTLGRVRDGASARDYDGIAAALADATPLPAATLHVGELSLMRSVLRPDGPEYTRLFAVPLAR